MPLLPPHHHNTVLRLKISVDRQVLEHKLHPLNMAHLQLKVLEDPISEHLLHPLNTEHQLKVLEVPVDDPVLAHLPHLLNTELPQLKVSADPILERLLHLSMELQQLRVSADLTLELPQLLLHLNTELQLKVSVDPTLLLLHLLNTELQLKISEDPTLELPLHPLNTVLHRHSAVPLPDSVVPVEAIVSADHLLPLRVNTEHPLRLVLKALQDRQHHQVSMELHRLVDPAAVALEDHRHHQANTALLRLAVA